MRKTLLSLALTALALTPSMSACAHEFMVIPELWQQYRTDQIVPLSVYSTHVYVRGEELEPEGSTRLFHDGQELPLTANSDWQTWDSKVKLAGEGTAIIAGHRLPMLYENIKYEKFAKLLLPTGEKTDGFNKVLGQRLEIVPLDDPFKAEPGDEIRFRILLDGKPVLVDEVYATYDGFSDIPNAWAFCSSPTAYGEATVKITRPGLWIVRVGLKLDEKGDGWQAVDLKSILTFPVR